MARTQPGLTIACMIAGLSGACAASAHAETPAVVAKAAPMPPGPPPISFAGITVYGTIDVAATWQSHGVPYNGYFAPSLEYVVSKNSGKSRVSYASNALSQSKLGLKGKEGLTGDIALVFQAEMQFVPTSGRLVDALKSIVRNNGRPANRQSANADSSKDGEVFAGQAFFGLSSKTLGTITFGRQWSLILDNIVVYDPMAASHAFSVIGYQGAAQAGASTEDARLDRALKYTIKPGHARLSGLFQFGDAQSPTARAYGVDIGYDWNALSVDGTYMHVSDSVSAAGLTPEQFAVLPHNSLAASISDNDAFAVFARYSLPRAKLFAGVERIEYRNPDHPITPGYHTVGGYLLSVVNNQAYPHHRLQTYSWAGLTYDATSRLALTAAYYRVDQNSYGAQSCDDRSLPTCSGHLDAFAFVGDYRLTRRFDLFSGAMYSQVAKGLASGFLHRSTVDPTVGARLNF